MAGVTFEEIRFKLMFEGQYISYRDFVPQGISWDDITDE